MDNNYESPADDSSQEIQKSPDDNNNQEIQESPDDNGSQELQETPVQNSSQSMEELREKFLELYPNSFAKWSQITGILALVSTFSFTIYLPLILGSISIILALLSRGKRKMHSNAKAGTIMGGISIGLNICIVILSFSVILGSGPMHDRFNETFKEIYGQSFDEMIEEMQEGSFDPEDFLESYEQQF